MVAQIRANGIGKLSRSKCGGCDAYLPYLASIQALGWRHMTIRSISGRRPYAKLVFSHIPMQFGSLSADGGDITFWNGYTHI